MNFHKTFRTIYLMVIFVLISTIKISAQTKPNTTTQVQFKNASVSGLNIFYREAGPASAPTILLLHGFPSSSHMYQNLIIDLSAKYHVIAPDYPGSGYSSRPAPSDFVYTFDNVAALMDKFIDAIQLKHFSIYMQDYGGPIGYRIAVKRPQSVQALIIQNANAYLDGLGEGVQTIRRLHEAGDEAALDNVVNHIISFNGIKEQYIDGTKDTLLINPDEYWSDHYFMERPGSKLIQATLLKNYVSNFPKYTEWQKYLRTQQPPALIVWGKNDKIFIEAGAKAYLRDLKNTELHLLDAGHFALADQHAKIAGLIDAFMKKHAIHK
jgi:pimeloyl-ACP methyl ester carboxylesterase